MRACLGWHSRSWLLFEPLGMAHDLRPEHRPLPTRVDLARPRNHALPDRVEDLWDATVGRVLPDLVWPIARENLVGLAAEQQIVFLIKKEAVKFLAANLVLKGPRLAAELEPLVYILGQSAGRVHDAVHRNPGA